MELDLAGMHQLAIEQGIDLEQLDAALEEALRLAYLKTPHAAKHGPCRTRHAGRHVHRVGS